VRRYPCPGKYKPLVLRDGGPKALQSIKKGRGKREEEEEREKRERGEEREREREREREEDMFTHYLYRL
jgi:hypothetical protein